ncbi:hypothetical protein SEA_LEGOLAS_46 [Mycobacterium phage Legolas]|uniref:Uncharacterized protein n=1 Tax=Mycobacterium phage Legolas TaxID=2499046 RepID=A0A3S9UE61_9CAUD|nr:hypothetical protein SEA_LEGOLAS_46 [Mycobacterium phage Legolas]
MIDRPDQAGRYRHHRYRLAGTGTTGIGSPHCFTTTTTTGRHIT